MCPIPQFIHQLRIAFPTLWVLLLLSQFPVAACAQSQGPFNPGTLSNNTATCPFAYSSGLNLAPAGNAATTNNVYASASHCDCCDANTSCLQATNFGFSIPAGSIITGIQVDIEKRRSVAAGGVIEDNGLRLIKGGTVTGSDRANFGLNWPTTDTYSTYGGSSDLWGTTWTLAEVNAANFGCAFACISYTCGATMTSFVDHIRITVFYTPTLPLEIGSFDGEVKDSGVQLHWTAHDLAPQTKLAVMRSSDGVDFESVGNANAIVGNYSDTPEVAGMFWYYLEANESENTQTSSIIGPMVVHADQQWRTRMVDGFIELSFEANDGQWKITDVMGRRIANGSWNEAGHTVRIPVYSLGQSLIFLSVEAEGAVATKKYRVVN
jgi:hypothetical protein